METRVPSSHRREGGMSVPAYRDLPFSWLQTWTKLLPRVLVSHLKTHKNLPSRPVQTTRNGIPRSKARICFLRQSRTFLHFEKHENQAAQTSPEFNISNNRPAGILAIGRDTEYGVTTFFLRTAGVSFLVPGCSRRATVVSRAVRAPSSLD